jgi:uncharacterized protein YdeI (YjbR/CyaY-like superfamily)
MGKKKKKKKKQSGNPLSQMTAEQLLENGFRILSEGNARNAITHFQEARRKAGRTSEIELALFQGYLDRYRQLLEKGMKVEAETV